MKIVEPKPERARQRDVTQDPRPRDLLRRWLAIGYAVAKLLVGGILVWGACFMLYGLLVTVDLLPRSESIFVLWLFGMLLVAKLYGVWVLPVRY